MKKYRVMILGAVGAVASSLCALGGTPFKTAVTVTAGTSTTTMDRDYYATKVTHVLTGAVAGTNTVKVVQDNCTNTIGTIVVASGNILVVSNTVWLFKGDKILVENNFTNTHSAVIVGELAP
ncbi:MAG: hypothetical protein R6X19_03385 [Kiritimatiellia bacterium]